MPRFRRRKGLLHPVLPPLFLNRNFEYKFKASYPCLQSVDFSVSLKIKSKLLKKPLQDLPCVLPQPHVFALAYLKLQVPGLWSP